MLILVLNFINIAIKTIYICLLECFFLDIIFKKTK